MKYFVKNPKELVGRTYLYSYSPSGTVWYQTIKIIYCIKVTVCEINYENMPISTVKYVFNQGIQEKSGKNN